MPDDEEVLDSAEEEVDTDEVSAESEEQAPDTKIEERLAALEAAQRQSVLEIRSAIGRVQSLQAQLSKTNDSQVEAKLRQELNGVSELIGLVSESIDETILPKDVKRRVQDVQNAARVAAADAEINRRIAEATRPAQAAPQSDADQLEAAVVSQIRAMGLNDQDPAFDWGKAASILANSGQAAMWAYFSEVEKTLLGATPADEGPARRPRQTSPKTVTPTADVDNTAQLTKLADDGDLDKAVALLRSMGVNA